MGRHGERWSHREARTQGETRRSRKSLALWGAGFGCYLSSRSLLPSWGELGGRAQNQGVITEKTGHDALVTRRREGALGAGLSRNTFGGRWELRNREDTLRYFPILILT